MICHCLSATAVVIIIAVLAAVALMVAIWSNRA